MRRRHVRRYLAVIATVAVTSLGMTGAITASASGCQYWGAPAPNQGTGNNQLNGVTVVSGCSAWAAGWYYDTGLSKQQTLIEHWNGTRWNIQPSPNANMNTSVHLAVDASSATNAWAVGTYHDTDDETLVEYWDGTSWTIQPTPTVGGYDLSMNGVTAVSPIKAWAVGQYYYSGSQWQTVVERWNGVNWKRQVSPNPGSKFNFLLGVDATSSSNAWAVGRYVKTAGNLTLIEHWNGTKWTKQTSRDPGTDNILNAVAATSGKNAWAVGQASNGTAYQTLIEHWNGTRWNRQASPSPGGPSVTHYLTGVTAASATNAWAVGYYLRSGYQHTLVEHWNGKAWTVQRSPNPSSSANEFQAVAASSSSNVWAVGFHTALAEQTLVAHCC